MENDEQIAWLNYMHKLYKEKRLYLGGDYKENEELDRSVAISVCTSPYDIPEDEYYAIKYPGVVKDHFTGTDEKFEFGLKKLITKSKEIFDSLPDGGKVE